MTPLIRTHHIAIATCAIWLVVVAFIAIPFCCPYLLGMFSWASLSVPLLQFMMAGTCVLLLAVSMLFGKGADFSEGHNHEAWTCVVFFLVAGALADNPFAGVLIAIVGLGIVHVHYPSHVCTKTGWKALAVAFAYVTMSPYAEPWMIAPVLTALAFIGAMWGAVTWYAVACCTCQEIKVVIAPGIVIQKDTLTTGNRNHAEAAASCCVAAGLGVIHITGWYWMWGVVGLSVMTILYPVVRKIHGPGQGIGHLIVGGTAWAIVSMKPPLAIAIPLAAVVIILGVLWDMPRGMGLADRIVTWVLVGRRVLKDPSPAPMMFGFGMGQWRHEKEATIRDPSKSITMTTAHNEFFQFLYEYGPVGLIALIAMLWNAFSRTYNGGVEGEAMTILIAVICTVAAISFPWTFLHTHGPTEDRKVYVIGSHALVMISFVAAVLTEAV